MKLLDWILRPSPAQQFVSRHADVLKTMGQPEATRLANLLIACEFDAAAKYIWELDDVTRRDIPQKTWSFLLSLG